MVSLQPLVGSQPVVGPLPVLGPQCPAPRFVIPTIPDGCNLSLRNPLVILKGGNRKVPAPPPHSKVSSHSHVGGT